MVKLYDVGENREDGQHRDKYQQNQQRRPAKTEIKKGKLIEHLKSTTLDTISLKIENVTDPLEYGEFAFFMDVC